MKKKNSAPYIVYLVILPFFCLYGQNSKDDIRPPLYALRAYSEGLLAEQAGRPEEALVLYKQAAITDTTSYEILWDIFFLAQDLSDYISAIDAGEKLIRYFPDDEDLLTGVIQLYLFTAQYDKARRLMERFLDRYPDDLVLTLDIAKLSIISGDTAKAISLLDRIKKKSHSNSDILKAVADTYLEAMMLDKAEPVFKSILKNDPKYSQAYLGLAIISEQKNDHKQAKDHYQRYFKIAGTESEIFLSYLSMLARAGKLNDAIQEAKTYLLANQEDYQVVRRLGYMLLSTGETNEALTFLRKANLSTDDPSTAFFIAEIFGKMGEPDSAKSYWEQYLNKTKTLMAGIEYAQFLMAYNDTISAISIVDSLSNVYPDSSLTDMFYGFYYLEKAEFELSVKYFKLANKKAPGDYRTLFALGDSYERLGVRDSSIAIMKRLYMDMPDDPMVMNYLGFILAESDTMLDFADSLVKRALELEPQNPAFLDSYAWVLYRKKEYKKALLYIDMALSAMPDDFLIFDHKGDILYALGEKDDALKFWNRAIELVRIPADGAGIRVKIEGLKSAKQ
jgi:tetratricopeptide (TPR) repeat protein